MRIAVLIDVYGSDFIGGGQIHVRNVSKKLRKLGHSVRVFSQKNPHIIARFFWAIWVVPWVIFSHIYNKYDIVHSHGYISGISAKIISIFLKIPVVHTVHGSNLLDIGDQTWKGKLEKFLLLDIPYDAEISVSQNFLNYKPRSRKVVVVPNGVDVARFEKANLKSLNKNKTPKEGIIFLYVGRMEAIKGVDILLKALKRVKSRTWTLRLVGEGSEKEELVKLSNRLGISEKVQFLGKKNEKSLLKEYINADVFVLPSLSEGQPLTLLEAWAAKLPVLVTRVGHNPYIVVNGKDGLLVNPRNISELCQKLEWMIANIDKLRQMGLDGHKKAKKWYDWNEIGKKTMKIYNDVLLGYNHR
ncbi:MAG: glycosyltransferase family 4 protein [Patescibacteria group bacterium]|jgi:glycosyltransferase involved in cell wall biosynthesis